MNKKEQKELDLILKDLAESYREEYISILKEFDDVLDEFESKVS